MRFFKDFLKNRLTVFKIGKTKTMKKENNDGRRRNVMNKQDILLKDKTDIVNFVNKME